eukprot:865021_1
MRGPFPGSPSRLWDQATVSGTSGDSTGDANTAGRLRQARSRRKRAPFGCAHIRGGRLEEVGLLFQTFFLHFSSILFFLLAFFFFFSIQNVQIILAAHFKHAEPRLKAANAGANLARQLVSTLPAFSKLFLLKMPAGILETIRVLVCLVCIQFLLIKSPLESKSTSAPAPSPATCPPDGLARPRAPLIARPSTGHLSSA